MATPRTVTIIARDTDQCKPAKAVIEAGILSNIFLKAVTQSDSAVLDVRKGYISFTCSEDDFLRLVKGNQIETPFGAAYGRAQARLKKHDEGRNVLAKLKEGMGAYFNRSAPHATVEEEIKEYPGARLTLARYTF